MKEITNSGWESIVEFCRRVSKQELRLPAWQRHCVWDEAKIKTWKTDMDEYVVQARSTKRDQCIPGVVLVFTIKGRNDSVWINDGGNRIRNTQSILDEAKANFRGDPEARYEYFQETFGKIKVFVQHFVYDTEDEAFHDFIRANLGTLATPRELGKGILATKIETFEHFYRKYLDDVIHVVGESLARLNCVASAKRTDIHKQERDALSLFHRHATGLTAAFNYNSGTTKIDIPELGKTVEYRLVDACNSWNEETATKKMALFRGFLDRQVAMLQTIWRDIIGEQHLARPLPQSTAMWLFHFCAYTSNNQLPVQNRDKFMRMLLNHMNIRSTTQLTTVYDHDPQRQKTHRSLGRSNLSHLQCICELINFDRELLVTKVRASGEQLARGYDNSHETPFVTHGDGPTFPEPAANNRARGAAPV